MRDADKGNIIQTFVRNDDAFVFDISLLLKNIVSWPTTKHASYDG